MKFLAGVVFVVMCFGVLSGCAFKMGNSQFEVLSGLSHPTVSTTKTETVNATINNESVAK